MNEACRQLFDNLAAENMIKNTDWSYSEASSVSGTSESRYEDRYLKAYFSIEVDWTNQPLLPDFLNDFMPCNPLKKSLLNQSQGTGLAQPSLGAIRRPLGEITTNQMNQKVPVMQQQDTYTKDYKQALTHPLEPQSVPLVVKKTKSQRPASAKSEIEYLGEEEYDRIGTIWTKTRATPRNKNNFHDP